MAGSGPGFRLRRCATGAVEKCKGRLREATARLTPRQRVVVLSILFSTFVVVDIVYIARGLRGDGARELEIEHLRQIEILKPIHYDSIPNPGIGR